MRASHSPISQNSETPGELRATCSSAASPTMQAAMLLRPHSVPVSAHISAICRVCCTPPALRMPVLMESQALSRMSLKASCTALADWSASILMLDCAFTSARAA